MILSHGDGGNGRAFLAPWLKTAEKYKVVIISPSLQEDVPTRMGAFEQIRATIAHAVTRFKTRPKAFGIGFSSGGTHFQILANDSPELFAGFAAHSSSALGNFAETSPAEVLRRMPILITCGMKGRSASCQSSVSLVSVAKRKKFANVRYQKVTNVKGLVKATERFMGRYW